MLIKRKIMYIYREGEIQIKRERSRKLLFFFLNLKGDIIFKDIDLFSLSVYSLIERFCLVIYGWKNG